MRLGRGLAVVLVSLWLFFFLGWIGLKLVGILLLALMCTGQRWEDTILLLLPGFCRWLPLVVLLRWIPFYPFT
jgi:hypothetical protein